MTIIKDGDNLAEDLLENWGNWAYSDPYRHLGYSEQPIFKDYRAPTGEKRPPSKPVVERDAVVANAAILHIRIKECPLDVTPKGIQSIYDLIVHRWAYNMPVKALTRHFGVCRDTIWRRSNQAKDVFMDEYLNIIRDIHRINKKDSANA